MNISGNISLPNIIEREKKKERTEVLFRIIKIFGLSYIL